MTKPENASDAPVRIPEPIREQLRQVLLDDSDLIAFLGQARRDVIGGDLRALRCVGMLPLRRPWDPETFEPRPVEVELRWVDAAWEVVALHGFVRSPA